MAKKDFGRRLMPEYLLKYSEELQKNHPDPSASWGGGSGGDYTAGEGIEISDQDVISIDEEVVAKKTDIPTKTSDLQNDSGFITGVTWNEVTGKPTFATVATSGSYNDLTDKPTIPTVDYPVTDVQVDGVSVVSNKVASITMPDVSHDLTYVDISYDSDHSTYNWPDSDTTAEIISKPYKYAFHIVDKTSWSALTYPSQHYMAFYDTTYFKPTTGNMCYIWRGVFACASAKYPYIAVLDYEVNVGWSLRYEEVKIQWKDVDYKPTFASVATSGNYNDLSDKPTIPTVPTSAEAPFLGVGQASDGLVLFSLTGASGTYYKKVEAQSDIRVNLQALNPNFGSGLTASYNSTTKKLDVSIDTTTVALKSEVPSNYVTTDTSQTITGAKTFQHALTVENTLYGISTTYTGGGRFVYNYNNQGTIERTLFDLPTGKTAGTEGQPTQYTIATTDDIPSLSGYATETWVGQQGFLTGITSSDVTTALGYTPGTSNFSGSYTDLTDKPTIPTVNDATITFTQGGTTKGTITLNQSTDATIALDAGGGSTLEWKRRAIRAVKLSTTSQSDQGVSIRVEIDMLYSDSVSTFSSLRSWLYSNGYNSQNKLKTCNGYIANAYAGKISYANLMGIYATSTKLYAVTSTSNSSNYIITYTDNEITSTGLTVTASLIKEYYMPVQSE